MWVIVLKTKQLNSSLSRLFENGTAHWVCSHCCYFSNCGFNITLFSFSQMWPTFIWQGFYEFLFLLEFVCFLVFFSNIHFLHISEKFYLFHSFRCVFYKKFLNFLQGEIDKLIFSTSIFDKMFKYLPWNFYVYSLAYVYKWIRV